MRNPLIEAIGKTWDLHRGSIAVLYRKLVAFVI